MNTTTIQSEVDKAVKILRQGGLILYPTDTVTSAEGLPITFTFFKHASLAIDFDGRRIYVDPVGSYADYGRLPKADVVLVTHSHYDDI